MNTRHLIVLALVAITGLIAVFWSQSIDEPVVADVGLIPGLLDSINDVSQVRITDTDGDLAVTLNRGEAAWTVGEISDYTADSGKLRAFLLALGQAQKIEQKTSNPELYAELGVADPGSGEGAAVRIELDGLVNPAVLLVGRTSPGRPDATYVRVPGEAQSWLIDERVSIDRDPMDWVDRLVIDIAPETVRSLSIVDASGERFEISRDAPGTEYAFSGLPEGEQLKQSVANRLVGELGGFNFDNVERADDTTTDPDAFTVAVKTFGGADLSATLGKTEDKHFMTLAATAAAGATPDETATEVIETVGRRTGWRFEIPAFKYNQLDKKRDDLLENAAE